MSDREPSTDLTEADDSSQGVAGTDLDTAFGRTSRMEPTLFTHRRKRRRRSSAARRRRRRIRRRIYAALAIVVSALFVLGVLALLRMQKISAELKVARAESQQALDALNRQDLNGARIHLAAAADSFIRGRNTLDIAFELKLARLLPFVGPNLKAVAAMASAGATTADAGKNIIDSARRLEGPKGELIFPLNNGRIDLRALEELRPSVRSGHIRVEAAAVQVEQSPSSNLVGIVASGREEMLEKLIEARDALANLDGYLSVLPSLLGADEKRRYFVAIGNNAEMNAEGMILSYGIVEVTAGYVDWVHTGSITEIKLTSPAPVPLSTTFNDRWSWANPNFAWQRANVTPDFPTVGELLVAMYQHRTGHALDGAIYIDGVALGYLLRATGPISFQDPSVTLDDRNFAEYAMNAAYKSFSSQESRKEFLAIAAQRAVTSAFQISGDRARTLGSALSRAANERRLMFYSTHPDEQARLAEMSIGGRLRHSEGGFFSYTLQNFSGSKLDYYLGTKIDYRARVARDGSTSVNVRLSIENRATLDLPPYILGGDERLESRRPGDYFGYLTLYAPEGSFVTGGRSRKDLMSVLPDAGFAAFSVTVLVPPGGTEVVELEYFVPTILPSKSGVPEYFCVLYVPQPRFRPDSIRIEVGFDSGEVSRLRGFALLGERTLLYEDNPQEAVELNAEWRR